MWASISPNGRGRFTISCAVARPREIRIVEKTHDLIAKALTLWRIMR
jgi:hypothetical protein